MRIPIGSYPGMNRFVLDWLAAKPGATKFLARASSQPRPPGSARRVPADLVEALDDSNRRWGSFVSADLRRWAAGETVTLIAGQQTGFAGGPLYTLAKIASLVKMKRDLAARGVAATIFFWLATEDHDFEEAATLELPVNALPASPVGINRQLDLVTLRATRAVESRTMVGPSPIPESLITQLISLFGLERPSWLREGITFGDSFAELCATVFAEEKIVYVDALLPELRRAGAAVLRRMFDLWDPMQQEIAARSGELESAAYTPQIVARPGEAYTLLFRIVSGERQILHGGGMETESSAISTSALTRPLLQDYVFEPDVFIGGPSEVAYYAQVAPLHELLGIPMPRVALRGHALVAPKRIARIFERFGIDGAAVFSAPEALLAEREAPGIEEIRSIAENARTELARQMTRIGEIALPAEHAVARALNRSIGHIEFHFEKLTQRAVRALVRKDRERFLAIRELTATLYPDHHVQDRVVGWFAYWFQFGKYLVERVVDEIEPDSDVFQVISL